jgi:hypothetical protein
MVAAFVASGAAQRLAKASRPAHNLGRIVTFWFDFNISYFGFWHEAATVLTARIAGYGEILPETLNM